MTKKLITALIISFSWIFPAIADGLEDLTATERQALREEIRAYLLENPEVLYEAIDAYEGKQRAQQAVNDASTLLENYGDIFNDGHSMVMGNPNGDVLIAEFFDYKCGYCKRAYQDMAQMIEEDENIGFVLKEMPILGEESLRAARYAVAIRAINPEKYVAYHDKLVTETAPLTDVVLRLHAQSLNVDLQALETAIDDNVGVENLKDTQALAKRLNITGTPGFVVGDEVLRGYLPKAQMQEIIEKVRGNS